MVSMLAYRPSQALRVRPNTGKYTLLRHQVESEMCQLRQKSPRFFCRKGRWKFSMMRNPNSAEKPMARSQQAEGEVADAQRHQQVRDDPVVPSPDGDRPALAVLAHPQGDHRDGDDDEHRTAAAQLLAPLEVDELVS